MGNNERIKLKTLLKYWISHNREHSQEFRDWAARVKEFGDATASKELLQAALDLDKASESLSQALKSLEEGEP
jgi:hypothetical protein